MSARGAVYSGGGHLILILLAVIGMPSFFKRELPPEPVVISVEVLPFTDKTNIKPGKKAQKKKVAEPKKVKMKKDETPPPTKKDPPPPEPKPDNPLKVPTKEKKPEPKKEKKKKKPEIKPAEEAILKDKLKKVKQADAPKEKPKDKPKDQVTQKKSNKSDKPFDNSAPLAHTEKDAIMKQFEDNWNLSTIGGANAREKIVTLIVHVEERGYITKIKYDNARYNRDAGFRAAVDAAIRAVKKTKQIKGLPKDKMSKWRELELVFNPKNLY